ncbi:MAG: SpoIIE family protein phosphatase [Treponema sp.]|nr:SpoIIE family protein phosphatase [Treponema sp.]MBD5412125.1 SpoIIE family protein phosphatase [Treponema sp.]
MEQTIDTFANIPILAATVAGLVLCAILIACKFRNTSKISFVFFLAIGIELAGLVYTYFNRQIMYLVLAIFVSEIILLVYAFVFAVSDPKKRAEKKSTGEKADAELERYSQQAVQNVTAKYNGIIATNKDMTAKAAGFFSSEDSLSSFLQYFNKMIMEKTAATGSVILVYDENDDILAVKSLEGKFPPPYKLPEDLPHKPLRIETNFKFSQFATKGNIFGDIFTEGKPVIIADPMKDARIYQNEPEDFLKCGPYMFIPMLQDSEGVALVCISRAAGLEPFSEEEIETANILIDSAATALRPLTSFINYTEHAELTKEGDIATKFQKTLLPEKMPVISKLSIGKYCATAENVCGDYYDIIPVRKDRISFVMGDVAGKGMTSLVIMTMIRAMIRLVANTNQSAATIIEWVNKAICSEKNSMDHFASISLINYNSLDNTAQIATSGTNPVLLYSAADKEIKKISADCEPIGVEKNTTFTDIDLTLNAGDILITCTDGILESLNENGVQYSVENLKKVIIENCSLQGKDIANKVKDSLKKFCGTTQQYDDQSLLVVKIQG